MVKPIYGDPLYDIQETVGPNSINIKLNILDYKRFLEKVTLIRDGGQINITKMEGGRSLSIDIINRDSLQTSKMLGDKP